LINSTELPRRELISIKQRALRKNVWFSTLSKAERGIIDLTVKLIERIKSPTLVHVIIKIIIKLNRALKSSFINAAEEIGYGIAVKSTELAYAWGSHEAKDWRSELHFIRYLGIMHLNTPTLFRA